MWGKLAVMVVLCAVNPSTYAAVWYVDRDATGAGNGASWSDAFTAIQQAVDAASSAGSGEVWVAEGTYVSSDTPVVAMKANVALYGGFAGVEEARDQRNWETHSVTIDGQNARRCVTGANDAMLDGFTVTGGASSDTVQPAYAGGGMLNVECSPTVVNCTFLANAANVGSGSYAMGGGMRNDGVCAPVVRNCVFSGNVGGGMNNSYGAAPVVTDCRFVENVGVGMANHSAGAAAITDCVFSRNATTYRANGGGMQNIYSSPTVANCRFENNTVDGTGGGGMYNDYSTPVITNCVFAHNAVTGDPFLTGGAITGDHNSTATITNCTFYGNSATYGSAICSLSSPPVMKNCIVWGHSGSVFYGSMSISYSCIQGGYSGTGNIGTAPLLVDPDSGGFLLGIGSPCIDQGTQTGAPTTDIRGVIRPQGLGVDMGAYEFDDSPPTVQSISLVGTPPANAATVEFLVTFSESVGPVVVGDFTVSTTGVISTPPSVRDVSGTGSMRTVTVNTGIMDGALGLAVTDPGNSIADLAANALSGGGSSGLVHTTDTIAPGIISIMPVSQTGWQTPSGPTNSDEVSFTVSFSENVGVFDIAAVMVAGGGAGVAQVPADTGDHRTWTISVTGITGDSDLSIAVNAGPDVKDYAGNNLAVSGTSSTAVHMDNASPTPLITGASTLANASRTLTIDFGEMVNGFVLGMVLVANGTASNLQPSGAASSYKVDILGTGNATAAVSIPGGVVTDNAGNSSNPTASPFTFPFDGVAPTAEIMLGDPTPTGLDEVHFSVNFSEPLRVPLAPSNISLTHGSLAGSIAVSDTDPDYTVTVTLSDSDAEGALGITIPSAAVSDIAGNPYGGGASEFYTITNATLPVLGGAGMVVLLGLLTIAATRRISQN